MLVRMIDAMQSASRDRPFRWEDAARAALSALLEPTADVVEGRMAALTALAEHGIPTDVQELLLRGDGRGTIGPGALRKALAAAHAAMITRILEGGE